MTNKRSKPAKSAANTDSRRPKKTEGATNVAGTRPKFPYTNKPNSLRKFLDQIPKRPKPAKVNADTLKGWGLKDTNDQSIIRVLKALDLVGSNGEPTETYTAFMTPGKGPAVLGEAIRRVWAPLFELSHQPNKEEDEKLKNYFNIHSGGSDATLAFQIQTFKAACDYADLSALGIPRDLNKPAPPSGVGAAAKSQGQGQGTPAIHIDLHIHLPENKSRRDYEYIFEDIGKYILGNTQAPPSDE
jgi:hypothetical protein